MVHLKSERELELVRASADLVSRTLGEVARCIAPGVTTLELDDIAEQFVRDNGAEPAFKGYVANGLPPFPATLCVSVNDAVVHGIPDRYCLREGDLVSIDCGVRLNGFYGDSAYTFAVGEASDEDARLCRITFEALNLGMAAAQDSARVGDIGHIVQRHCEAAGYGVVRELVGHGIGRKLHEDPQVPNVGRPGRGRRIRCGATICIEPMVNRGTSHVTTDEDGWTIRTADGTPSAHYEHMVAITLDQPEILTTFAYIEEVVEQPPYWLGNVTHD